MGALGLKLTELEVVLTLGSNDAKMQVCSKAEDLLNETDLDGSGSISFEVR